MTATRMTQVIEAFHAYEHAVDELWTESVNPDLAGLESLDPEELADALEPRLDRLNTAATEAAAKLAEALEAAGFDSHGAEALGEGGGATSDWEWSIEGPEWFQRVLTVHTWDVDGRRFCEVRSVTDDELVDRLIQAATETWAAEMADELGVEEVEVYLSERFDSGRFGVEATVPADIHCRRCGTPMRVEGPAVAWNLHTGMADTRSFQCAECGAQNHPVHATVTVGEFDAMDERLNALRELLLDADWAAAWDAALKAAGRGSQEC